MKYILCILAVIGYSFSLVYLTHTHTLDVERTKVELSEKNYIIEEREKTSTILKQYNKELLKHKVKDELYIKQEDKLINENKPYYASDCFDANSLQHIQAVQQGTDTK